MKSIDEAIKARIAIEAAKGECISSHAIESLYRESAKLTIEAMRPLTYKGGTIGDFFMEWQENWREEFDRKAKNWIN